MTYSRRTHATWARLRRMRQAAQISFLALYLGLLLIALQGQTVFFLADLYFRLDPLVALAALMAEGEWIPRLALSLVTLGMTVVLGRVWCGWVCPMGTLLEWVRLRDVRHKSRIGARWRTVKYFLLALILAAALFGNLSLLVLDPLTLLTRAMTTAILPGLNYAITAAEHALYPFDFARPAIDGFERVMRGPILPAAQQVFTLNILIVSLVLVIVALNWLADRFWCRYLCPLGALLGLLSKFSLLRPVVDENCNRCAQCTHVCQTGAMELHRRAAAPSLPGVPTEGRDPASRTGSAEAEPDISAQKPEGPVNSNGRFCLDYKIAPSECTMCLDCLATCPKDAVVFQWRLRHKSGTRISWQMQREPAREYELTRRQALVALGAGAAGVALLQTEAQAALPDPLLIRPPGAQNEAAFLSRCLRCSQCMKTCPTSGLQPSSLESGVRGLWTPRLIPRLGQCDYGCNACGQVCPSGAIPMLDLAQKRQTALGMAVVDRNRCLPWASGVPCIVCEEMCPTPQKAIRLEEATMLNARGETVSVQRPYVLLDVCIGCGICEHQCPLGGQAAIRIYQRGSL